MNRSFATRTPLALLYSIDILSDNKYLLEKAKMTKQNKNKKRKNVQKIINKIKKTKNKLS
jgi:hypothetical protein